MIKAILFDIDGTLVSLKSKVYSPSLVPALAVLRQKGLLLFVATGRSRFEIRSEHLLDGLEFDGYLTNNGQDAYRADGTLLYGNPLDPADAENVLLRLEETGCAAMVVGSDECILSRVDSRTEIAMEAIHTKLPPLKNPLLLLDKPIYKITPFLLPEEMLPIMQLTKHCRMTQWFPFGHDIISITGGKKNAMLGILARYGLDPSEAMAFGDSENDIEMLRTAGIGVAMGNATPEAKAAADYVTADCDDDGILRALEHFGLL